MYIDASDVVRARVLEFLERYGDKGVVVLRAAVDSALENTISGHRRLGDFSYQQLVMKLRASGIEYNPANLLRILEREYGVIEKTYESSNQRWYRFTDLEAVKQALNEYTGAQPVLEEPRVAYIKVKYRVLEPEKTLRMLRTLASKRVLSSSDKRVFREFVFTDLSRIVSVMEEMMEYSSVFESELRILSEILSLSMAVSEKISCSTQPPLGEKKALWSSILGRASTR